MDVLHVGGLVVEREVFGEHFATSCYLVHPLDGAASILVDPGQGAAGWVEDRLSATGRELAAVLVTHGHMDHTWDARAVTLVHPAPVYVHPLDRPYLERPEAALAAHFPGALLAGHPRQVPDDCRDVPPDGLELAGVPVSVYHTPGHTPGSVCFGIGRGPVVVATGDTVLESGPGPVFPPLGDARDHERSLAALAVVLRGARAVLPGHGRCVAVGDGSDNGHIDDRTL